MKKHRPSVVTEPTTLVEHIRCSPNCATVAIVPTFHFIGYFCTPLKYMGWHSMCGKATKQVKGLLFSFCDDYLSINHPEEVSCCFSSERVCQYCTVSAQPANVTGEVMCQARLQEISVNSLVNRHVYGVNLGHLPSFKCRTSREHVSNWHQI